MRLDVGCFALMGRYMKTDYFDLEGLLIPIRWTDFKQHTSFFIPCVKCTRLRNQIIDKAEKANVVIEHKEVVEKGVKGIRVWRLV
jgi:hypothetical protein